MERETGDEACRGYAAFQGVLQQASADPARTLCDVGHELS